jgi:hypothetical protein
MVASVAAGDCQYLGDFISGNLGPRPMPNPWATNYVRNMAAEHGATDLIVDEQVGGRVVGSAYRCQ